MRLAHVLALAGTLGVAACAPGAFAATEFEAVAEPVHVDARGPVVPGPEFGNGAPPLHARPLLRHGYDGGAADRHARERQRREREQQSQALAREQRLGPAFVRPPGSRPGPFGGFRSDAFRNQTRGR